MYYICIIYDFQAKSFMINLFQNKQEFTCLHKAKWLQVLLLFAFSLMASSAAIQH